MRAAAESSNTSPSLVDICFAQEEQHRMFCLLQVRTHMWSLQKDKTDDVYLLIKRPNR